MKMRILSLVLILAAVVVAANVEAKPRSPGGGTISTFTYNNFRCSYYRSNCDEYYSVSNYVDMTPNYYNAAGYVLISASFADGSPSPLGNRFPEGLWFAPSGGHLYGTIAEADSLATGNGLIHGKPITYTIAATNARGNILALSYVTMTVVVPPDLSFSPQTLKVGTPASFSTTNSGGHVEMCLYDSGQSTFGNLPAGLYPSVSADRLNCVISGTPQAPSSGTYTIFVWWLIGSYRVAYWTDVSIVVQP